MILTILNLTRLWELLWLLRWHRHVLFVLGESDDRSKSINCVQLRDQNMPKPVLKYKMPDVERYQIPGISICSLSPCHRSEQSDCSIPKLANYDPPRRLFWKIGTWNQQSLRSTKKPPSDFVPLINPSSQDILTMAGKCSLKKMICPFKAPSILYRSCLVLSNVNFIFSIKKGIIMDNPNPIDEFIFFKMVIAPPTREMFPVFHHGSVSMESHQQLPLRPATSSGNMRGWTLHFGTLTCHMTTWECEPRGCFG